MTRAMKAYHIAKAQSPADLPEWLFDERERGVTRIARGRRRDDEEVVREPDVDLLLGTTLRGLLAGLPVLRVELRERLGRRGRVEWPVL